MLPVGSVVNTLLLGKNENVYISSPGADGKGVVTDYLENTKTGHITDLSSLYSQYDASAGLLDV